MELFFWPLTRRHGEPDLLLFATGGIQADVVLIEAKLGAGKSQWNVPVEEELAQSKHDQLVRYWGALRERDFVGIDGARLAGARPTVVYLTPHAAPPRAELDESCRRDSGIRLAWLSWRDLDAILAAARPAEGAEERVLTALRALLAHLELTSFLGFGGTRAAPVDASKTWRLDVGRFVYGGRGRVGAAPTWRFGEG